MNIEKRRAEIAARKAEIRKLIEGDSENKLNMDDLEKELRELNEEDEKLEKRQAIERVESGVIHAAYIADALKIVKSIGLLSLFGSSATSISKELLIAYAQKALTIKSPEKVIDALTAQKIIRFASYKSSYILFEELT